MNREYFLKTFYLSIFAGIAIGFGGLLNLYFPNKYVGAICFSIGIILIMIYKWNLFTGYVPNIKEFNFKKTICYPIIIFIGNIVGTSIIGFISHFLPMRDSFIAKAELILSQKSNLIQIFFSAILCGFIIAMIVKSGKYKFYLAIPLISFFILLGAEHCIANSFYCAAATFIPINKAVIVSMIGNYIGGIIFIGQRSQE